MDSTDNEELLLFTGLNDALIGTALVWNVDGTRIERAVYSGPRIVKKFMQDGMDRDEALEFIDFNTEGAYVGPATPVVVWPADPEDPEARL